jgi:FtsP/CotA-like multicopper oxidase with cupredoxin domain
MLKRMSLLVAVVALMWASAPSAQAALIVGDLSITGDLVPVNIVTGTMTSIGAATGLDFNILGSSPTPGIPGNGGHQRYVFTPDPAGSRWYHSHRHAGRSLHKGTYTGQFGLFIVDGGDDPGAYDQEVPILLHEWEPRFTTQGVMDVDFKYYTINGKSYPRWPGVTHSII